MGNPSDDRRLRIRRFLECYPQLHDEVFRFMEPELRALALDDLTALSQVELTKLADRIKYLSKQRLPEPRPPRPRCNGKPIYDEQGARSVANVVWAAGRGEMRVYHCPMCNGHHLTHTELREP
jgi:hypothetical protein